MDNAVDAEANMRARDQAEAAAAIKAAHENMDEAQAVEESEASSAESE